MEYAVIRFDKGLIQLDGAMGTLLQQNGLKPGMHPEEMNLTAGEAVTAIHRTYVEAGSRIIYTNTFGANARKLASARLTPEDVIPAAVQLAKAATAGTDALVALDIGPIGELLEPMGTLTFEEAYAEFARMAKAGAAAGADLAVIETMTDLYEAKAALLAVKENTSLPVLVTMSFEATGRTFTGCTMASMARTLEGLGADAIGINCSLGPVQAAPFIRELAQHTSLPIIAKPNAGLPDPVTGSYDLTPAQYAQAMLACADAGATLLGGCCGTSPDYLWALRDALADHQPAARAAVRGSFVCSPTRPLAVDGVRVIGERINPTGKKLLKQALLEEDLDYVASLAVEQMDAGADLLDVNVGMPGVDEVTLLPKVVRKLQSVVPLPLQLDTTNPAALEAALRVYNGKAAVNSVNGSEESLRTVLPIVKKYGAAVVGLCMDEKGLPATAEERIAIARRIRTAANAIGIPDEDLWIDCLALTVSAQQEQAAETLKALRAVRYEMGLNTVLGVSNISFGLPNRPLITQTFMVQALASGLTLPIINPNQKELMDAIAAHRVLCCEDRQCADYVVRFAQETAAAAASKAAGQAIGLEESICRGLQKEAAEAAAALLNGGETGMSIVENRLIPSLDRVGTDYESGRLFLPQLLGAAQAAQVVFDRIRAAMSEGGETPVEKGRLIIATVKGDIHDIGKNIVKTVLENYGYKVLDLGRDVPPEVIVETVQAQGIHLVGLSALMTTTLPAMEETVKQLKALPVPPAIMVGGAVVTPDYAEKLGVHYAADARQAAEVTKAILG
ncbi:MAG: homocysteine S-methyltransferase family protein [Clostridia bacterium]|nr:homocysteine S-methyltransferase family protein [Clostridia bacterium]